MKALPSALEKLHKHIIDKQLFSYGNKLLLAVSGGSDSLGLLCLFSSLRSMMSITLLCCHVNHGLRGEHSDADEALVKQACLKLNVPLLCRKLSLEQGPDLENRARQARFEIFYQLLKLYRFDYIVLGHQKEDQAETIFMNMFRGTGINGMAGIKPKQGKLLHPLLGFERSELQEIVQECGFSWALDASNEDIGFKRNHMRRELIPYLKENFAPDLLDKLGHLAAVMEDADDFMRLQAATRYRKRRIESEAGLSSFKIKSLQNLSHTELYYLFKHCYSLLSGMQMDFFSSSFRALLDLMKGSGSAFIELPNGVVAYREYDLISFSKGHLPEVELQPQSVAEDRTWAIFGGFRFQFKHLKLMPKDFEPSPYTAILEADHLDWPLCIRSREPGDRFVPSGMNNGKKLKDFFIDCKVPRRLRDRVPIITDSQRILWVVGHRADERALPKETSTKLLQIIAEPVDQKPKKAVRVKSAEAKNEIDEQ